MAISTYSELKDSILNFLGRPNDPLIPTADIISLVEATANRRLRTQYQETNDIINTIAGFDTYALPSDFLEHRELRLTLTSPTRVIEYLSPSLLDETWTCNPTGQPLNFTIEGTNFRLAPVPDGIYTLKLSYWAKIPPLGDDAYAATAINSIVDSGISYEVDDVLIVSGGIPFDPVTLIKVDSVSVIDSYALTDIDIEDGGSAYTVGDIVVISGGTFVDPAEITIDEVQELDSYYLGSITSIDSGGSLYSVNDILTLSGGVYATPAQVRATAVDGGGTITALSVETPGSYSTLPANPVSVSGGTGSGATFVGSYGLVPLGAILSAHISNGGDYSVTPGGTASVSGGSGLDATFTTTWTLQTATGEITAAHILEAGSYDSAPSNPVETTGGSGDGSATFNLTYNAVGGSSNWLLTHHPDAYIYGALCEASIFLGSDNSTDLLKIFLTRREQAFAEITQEAIKHRTGGSPLIMRPSMTGKP